MALAWNAGWVNALRGSNPLSSALVRGAIVRRAVQVAPRPTNSRRSMRRWIAVLWNTSFLVLAGILYFFFVLPRWNELTGDWSHTVGTVLRIVVGALIGLAALPVVFTLLRTRKPEYGTPRLALSLRVWSIALHVLAGAVSIGAAISETWLSLDSAGPWLCGIYGAGAAIALLGA